MPPLVPATIATDALLARVGGDRTLLGAMVALFLGECPAFVAGIRRALADRDGPALERTAHALRGAVSNFAADDAAQAALALEVMGRDGDLTKADQAFRALEDALERLRPALEELR